MGNAISRRISGVVFFFLSSSNFNNCHDSVSDSWIPRLRPPVLRFIVGRENRVPALPLHNCKSLRLKSFAGGGEEASRSARCFQVLLSRMKAYIHVSCPRYFKVTKQPIIHPLSLFPDRLSFIKGCSPSHISSKIAFGIDIFTIYSMVFVDITTKVCVTVEEPMNLKTSEHSTIFTGIRINTNDKETALNKNSLPAPTESPVKKPLPFRRTSRLSLY